MTKSRATIRGILHLWSETGTEGGHWALQDERFITKNTTRFSCKRCGAYWDKGTQPDGPAVDDLTGEKKNLLGGSYCAPGTHDFQLICPEDWSYEGLHVLKDGDKLTIYSKDDPSAVVWSGKIRLRQYPLFTNSARGLWIHADQVGIPRKKWAEWFFKGYPAKLLPASKPKQ